jgi:hypothetical protein
VGRGQRKKEKRKGGLHEIFGRWQISKFFRLIQNVFFDKKVNPNQELPQKVPNISRATYVQY